MLAPLPGPPLWSGLMRQAANSDIAQDQMNPLPTPFHSIRNYFESIKPVQSKSASSEASKRRCRQICKRPTE